MSIQWAPDPYFYPIQIAQFALEHYSKNLTGESNLCVFFTLVHDVRSELCPLSWEVELCVWFFGF